MARMKVFVAVALILSLAACAEQNSAVATSDRVESPGLAVAKSPPSTFVPASARTAIPTATVVVAKLVPTATPSPVPTTAPLLVPTWTPKARPSTPTPTPIPDEVIAAHMPGQKSEDKAPDFELTLFNGETLRLSDLRGQVVVLNFWASWCPPCRWEMPSFERAYQEYRDDGVVFVGVAISDLERSALEFAELTGVTYPIGLDATGEISRAYRVLSLPTTAFIDPEGNITRRLSNVANEAVLKIFIEGQLRTLTSASGG